MNPQASSDRSSDDDSIRYTRTRVVNILPKVLEDNRVITSATAGPAADAYKILCVQIMQRMKSFDGNALAVVSPGYGDGKTLTAINLALSLAQELDKTVLLVDANLRDPSVHKYFGFVPEAGLSDHLVSNTPVDRILVNPGIDHFVILPGGRPIPNSTEMLGSQRMVRLVQELKERYPSRIVIFDLPPILSVADAVAFAPYVDAAVMVARENATKREELRRAASMLASTALIGTVMNDSRGLAPEVQPESIYAPGLLARMFSRRRR